MSSPPDADPETAGRIDRATGMLLRVGFWIPLLGCTWLALTPSPPDAVFRVSDVVLHGLAFVYLTLALGVAHVALRPRAVIAWMLGYGVLIELVQSLEPSRSAELKDLLVDGAGIVVGTLLLLGAGGGIRRVARRLVETVLGDRSQRANS